MLFFSAVEVEPLPDGICVSRSSLEKLGCHAILLVLLVQNSDLFVSFPFTVLTLSDQLSSISPQVWPDLEKAGPDEELHRANGSNCRLWAPYKVEL